MDTTKQDAERLARRLGQWHDGLEVFPTRAGSAALGWRGRSRLLKAIAYGVEHRLFLAQEGAPGWWTLWIDGA